ncbi:MFS transporter [Streptomyces sp. NPDC088194]|uniref:MFS transporter n=1 Tax=Streptomyces sp. NPDC088194 TaxID=3154931 RepID=UPI0034501FE2
MSSPDPAASYAAVFRLPHARVTFGAALAGRFGYGVLGLALVLSLTAAAGSLAAGGLLSTVFGTVSVVLGPARADLVDRWGARRALPSLALPFATALLALAWCAGPYSGAAGRPGTAVLALLAAAAGSLCPPIGPTMRAVWGALAPDEALLQRAFSLDTVAEELLFLVGPLIAVAMHPVPALALSGLLIAAGSCALAASPAARLTAAPDPGAPQGRKGKVRSRLRLLSAEGAGVRRAAGAALAVGACLGGIDLYVIACADRAHHPGAVGWVLAGQSAGSAIGGLLHGRMTWRRSAAGRLSPLLAALAALLAVDAAASGVLPLLAVCVAATGTLMAPALSTAYLAAARLAPDGTATRATGWVNSAVNAGSSAGGALAAVLVATAPLPVCFLATAAVPALGALRAGVRGRNGQVRTTTP